MPNYDDIDANGSRDRGNPNSLARPPDPEMNAARLRWQSGRRRRERFGNRAQES